MRIWNGEIFIDGLGFTESQILIPYAAKLEALSPLKVLSRGYAVVIGGAGETIKTISQVGINDHVQIKLSDGEVSCRVEEKVVYHGD